MPRSMVLRPNVDFATTSTGWNKVGFSSFYQCVNDDGVNSSGDVVSPLDTTRCEQTTNLNTIFRVGYDDPSFPAGNLLITSVQPKIRLAQSAPGTALNSARVRLMVGSVVDSPDDIQLTSTTFVNKAGRSRGRNPAGGYWQQSDITDLRTDVWCNFHVGLYVTSLALLVNYTLAGSVSSMSPAGNISTTRPAIDWTFTQEDGIQQDRFWLKVFSTSQVFTPGFSPDTTDPVYDTGETFTSQTEWQLDQDLPSAGIYVAYVKAGFSIAGTVLYSDWNNTSFTVVLDPPAAPSIVITGEPESGRNLITFSGVDNLLNQQDSDFEDIARGVGGWVNFPTPAALTQDSAQAAHGTYSMKVTATGSGQIAITGPLGNVVFPQNNPVTAIVYARANSTARSIQIQFNWTDKNNGTYTATVSGATNDAVGSWTKIVATTTPPAGADRVRISILINSVVNGEIHWLDQIAILPGTSTTWSRGGFANKNLVSYLESTAEGTITPWTSDGSASISSGAPTAKQGSGSILLTQQASTANNYMLAKFITGSQFYLSLHAVPVNPDLTYTVSIWCYGTAGRRFYCGLYSVDANGVIIGGSDASADDGALPPIQTFAASNTWQKAWQTGYKPATNAVAVIPYVIFKDTPTGGTGRIDELMISTDDYEVINPTQDGFVPGDLVITKTPLVEYSDDDGNTWQTLRDGDSFRLDASQHAILFDYEAFPGVLRQYRGSVAVVDSNGVNFKSPVSATAMAELDSDVYWLKSVSDPSKNISGFAVSSVETDVDDQVGVFRPLGRRTAITVEDVPGGEDGRLEITTINREQWQALKTLVNSGDVLILVSPFGEGRYIKLTGQQSWDAMMTVDSEVHKVTLNFVEVGKPA